MTRVIGTMGDKLLGLLLKEERAGACVPEHGTYCYCKNGVKWYMNCYGICKARTTAPC
ncbi:hypothetical protein [Streptomyces sp. CC208A]|uniref:hypothetical protein n=1 Tax=Streptomyces sp. CC208A TaxID=3044573 RepID=UPI0024A9025F|nr:hypothetical protein [Streptomyces sp. CC208A]